LYDGFTPPPSYQFVDPPPFFRADNVKPKAMSTSIALGPDGSAPAGIATPDGQFVVSLARGAIAPAAGATSVAVHVTPLAPDRLPAAPDGLRANGNVYAIDMTYAPTGTAVTGLAKPGSLLLEMPEVGDTMFRSVDATQWRRIPSQAITGRQLGLSATFAVPGYYLAATRLPELAAQPGRSKHTAVILGIVTVVVALAMFGVAYFVVRRRARRSAV